MLNNFKDKLGNFLITLVHLGHKNKTSRYNILIMKLLESFGKIIPRIYLDEALIYVLYKKSIVIKSNSYMEDKLVELGANKNILSRKPYSIGLRKFLREYGNNAISWNNFSNHKVNKIVLKAIFGYLKRTLSENPLKKLKNIIHITGSNGKGSTASFLQSILEAHGYTVNKYNKPSLIRTNEEIIIHGNEIEDNYFFELLKKIFNTYDIVRDTEDFNVSIDEKIINNIEIIKKHLEKIDFLQLTTAASFLAFYENPADYNIVEVGIGGLNDRTNIFTEKQTVATILTNIQSGIGSNDNIMFKFDEYGKRFYNNISTAYHKAMLGKYGVPMIVANQTEDVLNEIRRVAKEEVETNTVEYGRDWFIKEETQDDFIFEGCGDYKLKINKSRTLFEKFQVYNIATAIAAFLSIIKDKSKIKPELIQRGIDNTSMIGRPQRLLSGGLVDYFGYDKNIDIISGVIKLNKSGVESIQNIVYEDKNNEYFNYFIYTSGNKRIVNDSTHKIYFFDFLKKENIVNNSKVIVYKKSNKDIDQMTWEYIMFKMKENEIRFIKKNNLSSSIEFIKNDIIKNNKIHKKNRIFILCDSMVLFDKKILFLNS